VLDGRPLVDAHVHVARLATLSADWRDWVATFGPDVPVGDLFDADGLPRPAPTRCCYSANTARRPPASSRSRRCCRWWHTTPNTWLEVSGLPPSRLPDYYGKSLARLASKMVFGTDWPGVPGVRRNASVLAKALMEAGCGDDEVSLALGGNAVTIFGLAG
jgi:hypothetical protein